MEQTSEGSIFTSIILIISSAISLQVPDSTMGQAEDFKQRAITQFQEAHYQEAIDTLQHALDLSENDPELHYYLGVFSHYLAYDSVPRSGFEPEQSDEILAYLGRAVELDPHYGNAYYFIGAEYGARACRAMQQGSVEDTAEQLRLGRQAGGYPDWLIEFGRNTLRSCPSHGSWRS